MQVNLLGPPDVVWAGRSIDIPRRQTRALLYILATCIKPISRDQLCSLFWAENPDSVARRNLTRLLTHLRRILPVPGALVAAEDKVWFEAELISSDAGFYEGFDFIQEPTARLQNCRRLIKLYRGPFLSGFSLPGNPDFEIWVDQRRQVYERVYLEALSTLVEDCFARRLYGEAIRLARRYLEVDDLAETIHRRLIELFALAGDRTSALRQFERCVVALERELGAAPQPETRSIYRSILENRFLPEAPHPVPPVQPALPDLEVPLIGREVALGFLDQAYRQAALGKGGLALILGEPGIGKSRLLREWLSRLQPGNVSLARPPDSPRHGRASLFGAGYADGQANPFQPVLLALRGWLSNAAYPLDVSPVWLAEASLLLPELRDSHHGLPSPVSPVAARERLFEALYQLLLGMQPAPLPLVLCLDDLHWADSSTLDWLGYLVHRGAHSRILVVAACQGCAMDGFTAAGDLHPDLAGGAAAANLTRLLIALQHDGLLTIHTLAGLDRHATLKILDRLPGAATPEIADRLLETTDGNPFFLLETLRVLLEDGLSPSELPRRAELPISTGVYNLVKARLERLRPLARQLLEAGAVLGAEFEFDGVLHTSGRNELEAIDSLDELIAHRLLLEINPRYRFRHEIVRQVVYRGLSYGRRRLLHRRAGEALQRLPGIPPATLAYHFEKAESFRLAAGFAVQAGQIALAALAGWEAYACFGRALALLERASRSLHSSRALAENHALRQEALEGQRLAGQMANYKSN